MSRYDTIVIGAGLAGLTTACHLAQSGQKVLLTAHGAGALLLASGCVDVLGYQPVSSQTPLENPLAGLPDFLADTPQHPYNLLGAEKIRAGLNQFLELTRQSGLDYRGQPDQNWLLPGPAGAIHPACLAPASMINGNLADSGRILIIGFRELKDFYPKLISENLNAQNLGLKTAAVSINAPAPIAGNMNVTPIELAHAFEKPEFRQAVIIAVKSHAKGYDRIGFPATLGLDHHVEVLADLQKKLDKPVFEISVLPPSVPGRRLFDGLRRTFLQTGGRLILGSKVAGGIIEAGRASHIQIETASRLKSIMADNFVLATGGIFGGGLQTNADGRVWEAIFNLPIDAESNRHLWFNKKFISTPGQPVAHYGVAVNQQFQPINGDGPLADNLFVVGAALAGSEWTRGRTGNGIAITTATTVAQLISGSRSA
jgi:glycerol-3-phosphate dehydrogenase subunit B